MQEANFVIQNLEPYRAHITYPVAFDMEKVEAGVKKAYTPNYMEGMSPAAYADLYTSIQISPKIEHYLSE